MNPVPLSKKQEDKIISNLDSAIQENYEVFTYLINRRNY